LASPHVTTHTEQSEAAEPITEHENELLTLLIATKNRMQYVVEVSERVGQISENPASSARLPCLL
jgi:hypothetical protein